MPLYECGYQSSINLTLFNYYKQCNSKNLSEVSVYLTRERSMNQSMTTMTTLHTVSMNDAICSDCNINITPSVSRFVIQSNYAQQRPRTSLWIQTRHFINIWWIKPAQNPAILSANCDTTSMHSRIHKDNVNIFPKNNTHMTRISPLQAQTTGDLNCPVLLQIITSMLVSNLYQ